MNPWNFTRKQVQWTLENFTVLSRGVWPDEEKAECYGRSALVSARARFEYAAMLAGELGARVRMCGLDGMLVEERYGMVTGKIKLENDIARVRHLPLYVVCATIGRVSWYITSERGTNGERRVCPPERVLECGQGCTLYLYECWRTRTRRHHHYRERVFAGP